MQLGVWQCDAIGGRQYSVRNFSNVVYKILAERAGFEPAEGFWPLAALAKRCFQPLSHLSTLEYSLSFPASKVKASLSMNRWIAENGGENVSGRSGPMLFAKCSLQWQFRNPPDVWPQRQLPECSRIAALASE